MRSFSTSSGRLSTSRRPGSPIKEAPVGKGSSLSRDFATRPATINGEIAELHIQQKGSSAKKYGHLRNYGGVQKSSASRNKQAQVKVTRISGPFPHFGQKLSTIICGDFEKCTLVLAVEI